MKKIETVEEFKALLTEGNRFVFVKNSTTCPVSHAAFEEFEDFSKQATVPTYYLNVQEARPLSNHIAEEFGIKHESPQAFVFEGGKPVWNASHWKITKKSLAEATAGN